MIRLTLLHTNDLHARVAQLSRIATAAKQIRREVTAAGDYCVLWDCGDAEDPILFESSMTKGRAMLEILRSAGYELEVLGNATPLRYGPQAVAGLAAAFGRPLLCANMIDRATDQLVSGLEPYTLQTFGDVTLGIIGLTAAFNAYHIFKLKLSEPNQILPGLIAEMRTRGATTIVLLSHLGSKQDIALAEQIDGLDVIIGAHDHVVLNPPLIVNQTIIAQATVGLSEMAEFFYGADVYYSDEYYSTVDNVLLIDDYTRVNGFIGIGQPDDRWQIVLSARNITDEEDNVSGIYFPGVTNIRTPLPPSEYMLTFKVNY